MAFDVDNEIGDLMTTDILEMCEGLDTFMISNIPCRCSHQEVVTAIDEAGFAGTYNFFYLPMRRNKRQNYGYAFISFVEQRNAQQFVVKMNGFHFNSRKSGKALYIRPARMQGLESHIQHFQGTRAASSNSPPVFDRNALAALQWGRDEEEFENATNVTRTWDDAPEAMPLMHDESGISRRSELATDRSMPPLQPMSQAFAAGCLPPQLPLSNISIHENVDEFVGTGSEDEQSSLWTAQLGRAFQTGRTTGLFGHPMHGSHRVWNQECEGRERSGHREAHGASSLSESMGHQQPQQEENPRLYYHADEDDFVMTASEDDLVYSWRPRR